MSLFKRLIGAQGDKISIHLFHSLIDESKQSRITGNQAADIMNLTTEEKADAVTIIQALSTETQYRRLFNYLALAELNVTTPYDYTEESLFWTSLGTF